MVEWGTNEAGTVHRAGAAVRGSRFLRLAEITDYSDYALLSVWAVIDADAYINQGLRRNLGEHTLYEYRFISVDHAKLYAEKHYLQP